MEVTRPGSIFRGIGPWRIYARRFLGFIFFFFGVTLHTSRAPLAHLAGFSCGLSLFMSW